MTTPFAKEGVVSTKPGQLQALFVLTAALALAYLQFDVSIAIRTRMIVLWPGFMTQLHGANEFAGDWLLALIVAANFTAAASLDRWGAPLMRGERVIRSAAGCTFSAYLYHMPLLVMAYLLLDLRSWVALLAVAAGVALLAQVTERQLPAARNLLRILFCAVARGQIRGPMLKAK